MKASIFDLLLSLLLIFLAWKLLRVKDIFLSVVLFIVFSLLMALAWVQLNAPDIALVEAAVGAGVTGALFLGTLGRLESIKSSETAAFVRVDYLLLLLTASLAGVLCWSVLPISANEGLTEAVAENLPKSGVENPVTAVILNFRGYDTLLEIGVLLLVVIATASLLGASDSQFPSNYFSGDRVLLTFIQLVTPLLTTIAMYFLWAGAHAPGGAFQAGSILGGTGVLLLLGGVAIPVDIRKGYWRLALLFGFAGFLLTGISVMTNDRSFLEYPQSVSGLLILFIETLCTLSIAVTFICLFKLCSGIGLRQSYGTDRQRGS